MEKNKYTIKYSATFIRQLKGIVKYIMNKLQNNIAAENLYKEVIKEIETRSGSPDSYEKYITDKNKTYYRIYVKNYTIFYTVKNNTMIVSRILYSRMNFNQIF